MRLIVWAQRLDLGDKEAQAECVSNAFAGALKLEDMDVAPIPGARLAQLRAAATKACPTK